MQNGYYSVTGGMVAQFSKLDTISNNLANMNTNGFKKSDLIFGDYMRLTKETREMNNENHEIKNHSKDGAKFLNRALNKTPHITEEYINFEIGSIKQTSNPLDFALNKENLFFSILTPDGVKLTKDGSFSINSDGILVNQNGHPVLSNEYGNGVEAKDSIIELPSNSLQLSSDENGLLSAKSPNGEEVPIYKLFVGQVENLRYLEKEGDNLYRLDNLKDLKPNGESASVMQGYIETSNINAVFEMSELIKAHRLVEMYQKAMKTQMDDLNTDAITKLARTKSM